MGHVYYLQLQHENQPATFQDFDRLTGHILETMIPRKVHPQNQKHRHDFFLSALLSFQSLQACDQ